MPNEVTQKLGFDAAQAVKALSDIRKRLNEFKQALTSSANAARQFSKKAVPAVSSMKAVAKATKAAAAGLRSIQAATGGAATAMARSGSQMQTVAASAQNMSAMYTQAVGGVGISTAAMANQVAASSSKAASSTTKISSNMNKANKSLQNQLKHTGAAVQTMGNQMQTAGKKGAAAAKTITINWKTIIRIIQAQVIIRAMSGIVSAFTDAARASIEFRLAIAEVKTIAPALLGDMDRISDKVRQLSADLGITADVVAEGLYQTLSNQVVEAASAFDFLRTAQELALITHADTRDAVNAMSSVMNSYSMSSEEATRVAGTLFKTIELGRLRLSEFADILGAVMPLTAEMGVEFEEAAAAMAVMTRQGVRVNRSITQLRAVMLKLIKPTEKMKELFKVWGVRTAEQAIKKFGSLTGVLKELAKETGGNSQEMAEYFNRVRAVVGYMGIMTNGGKLMTETFNEIKGATEAAKDEFEEYSQVPAHRIRKAINEIKLTFMEMWEKAQPALAELLEWIVKIIPDAQTLKITFQDIGTLLAWTAKIGVLFITSMVEGWVKIRNAVVDAYEALNDFTFGLTGGKSAAEKTGETIRQMYQRIDEEATRMNKHFDKMRIEQAKRDKALWKSNEQNVWNYLSEVSKVWSQFTDIIEAGVKSAKNYTDGMWDSSIKRGRDAISKLADVQKDFAKYHERSNKRAMSMSQRIHNQDYKLELEKAKSAVKHRMMLEEIDYKLARASEAYAKAGVDEEKHKNALEITHKAQEMALETIRHAREMDNRGAEFQAMEALARARNQEGKKEAEFLAGLRSAQEKDMRQWQDNLERKISRIDELRAVWNDINEQLAKQEDQRGQVSTDLRKRRTKVEAEIMKNLFSKKDMQIAEMLGLEEGLKGFNTGVMETMQRAKFSWEVEIARLQTLLNKTVFSLKADFGDIEGELSDTAQKVLGRPRLPYEDPSQFLGSAWDKAQKDIEQYREDEIKLLQLNTELEITMNNVKDIIDSVDMHPIDISLSDIVKKTIAHGGSIEDASKEYKKMGAIAVASYNRMEGAINNASSAALKGQYIDEEHLKFIHTMVNAEKEKGRLTTGNANRLHAAVKMIESDFSKTEEKRKVAERIDTGTLEASKAYTAAIASQTSNWAKEVERGDNKQKEVSKTIDISKTKTEEFQTAAKGVTSELTTHKTKYQQLLELMDQQTQKEQQYQETLSRRGDPSVGAGVEGAAQVGAEGGEIVSVQPVEQMTQTFDLLTQKIDSTIQKVPAIGTTFDTIVPHIDKAIWRLMDMEISTNDILQQTYRLQGGFDSVAEKIAMCSDYGNNLINVITNVQTATNNTDTAMRGLGNSISNNTNLAYDLASAMRAAAQAAIVAAEASARAARSMSTGENAYNGKLIKPRYHQHGGLALYKPRGRDRIPVMASAGETIINAKSSRQFFSQLQAINAGQQPQYRDQGGVVNNVGDINVSVAQGETSRQTAREIAQALRRELRRGTSTLS